MSNKGKRTLRAIIPHMVKQKKLKGDQKNTIDSFISDASAILESLAAELDERIIVEALDNQGFVGPEYVRNLRLIAKEAKNRRVDRLAGPLKARV